MSARDEDVNKLIERFPSIVTDYADVVAKVLRGLKAALHRQGYHGEAAHLGAYCGDLEMQECGAVELVARSILEVATKRAGRPLHGFAVVESPRRATRGRN